jgi:nucleoside-diphosphate-sugar epimerase
MIIGCGDIALRMAPLLRARYVLYALTRKRERFAALRAQGLKPDTLAALAGLAHDVVHFAPPPRSGLIDTRTTHLIAALAKGKSLPQQLVYISTSGVYGDCHGAIVEETRPLNPQTARALRRVNAERQLRAWGTRSGVRVAILRVPGIYASDRLPLARLERGTPAINADEDAFVNHIHADDLARIVVAALRRGQPNRSYNAVDDAPSRMGDYFDLVADGFGLPCPPRLPRAEAQRVIPDSMYSFMKESRQLTNVRIKRELRVTLRYPSVQQGIAAARVHSGRL